MNATKNCPECNKPLPPGRERCNWCPVPPLPRDYTLPLWFLGATVCGISAAVIALAAAFFAALLAVSWLAEGTLSWLAMGGGLLLAFLGPPVFIASTLAVTFVGLASGALGFAAILSMRRAWATAKPIPRASWLAAASPVLLALDLMVLPSSATGSVLDYFLWIRQALF